MTHSGDESADSAAGDTGDAAGAGAGTVLLAAVAGSAKLFERLSAIEARHAVDRCLKRMQRAVEGAHGEIVKCVGDELLARFTAADDALQAAAEMQQRIADLPPASGVKLAIRVGFRCGDGDAAIADAARLTALAAAGQVLTDAATAALLSPPLQLLTRPLPAGSEGGKSGGKGDDPPLEVRVEEFGVRQSAAALARSAGNRLCVRHRGSLYILDERRSELAIGRDGGCEATVRDRRASRVHARIERRGNRFVLVDQSTNGTFVTFHNEPEFFLRHEEITLRGAGVISVATSAKHALDDRVEFEHV
jgi:hypothetical protein